MLCLILQRSSAPIAVARSESLVELKMLQLRNDCRLVLISIFPVQSRVLSQSQGHLDGHLQTRRDETDTAGWQPGQCASLWEDSQKRSPKQQYNL